MGCFGHPLREGDHKGRPYVASPSLSEGEEFFSNHRRVDLGSERAKVGWCVIQYFQRLRRRQTIGPPGGV